MTKPVNLNRYRKEKARAEKKARADENVVKHGRTKAQKSAEDADNARITHLFDGHKREDEE